MELNEKLKKVINCNLEWFMDSGIMRPNDGFWGVAERILITTGNASIEKVNQNFYSQTKLQDGLVVLEHRRNDCALQAALMFDIAGEVFSSHKYLDIAHNIVEYLTERSGLRKTDASSPKHNLWGWSNPINSEDCWTDDNAWAVVLFIMLEQRGYKGMQDIGLSIAETLRINLKTYFEYIEEHGNIERYSASPLLGMKMNPHWIGLASMALAYADTVCPNSENKLIVDKYHKYVLEGAPAWDDLSSGCAMDNNMWSLSEYAYLSLVSSVCYEVYKDEKIKNVAETALDILISKQGACGNFPADHFEIKSGKNLADLIYTQNWATLGLQQAAKSFPANIKYQNSLDKSLKFLCKIQDNSDSIYFKGCWRGMYNCDEEAWGGGDCYEGGARSIYSGWTNAPINLAMLFKFKNQALL
jgi:hypothetical protein